MAAKMSTPFHTLKGRSDAALVFCDHASNRMPAWVGDLGLHLRDRDRHIAWDLGAEAVTRGLCEALGVAGHICAFSRLVIDVNRAPDSPSLIPGESDGTPVPGNRRLAPERHAERVERLYAPYHAGLGHALDRRPATLAISVHSFTPQLRGQPRRPTDIGLLVKEDGDTAAALIEQLSEVEPNLRVDINEPYSAYDLNWTVDHNVVPRGLRHLAIELRQDHLATDAGVERMVHTLARAIRPLL